MRSIRSRRVPLSLVLILATQASVQASEEVQVTNFPSLQRVEIERFPELQAVRVVDHAPVTSAHSWSGRGVAPVSSAASNSDLERYKQLEALGAAGFASLGLSVVGRLSGSSTAALSLELVLLPDTPFIVDAWKEDGVLLLEQRVDFNLKLDEKGLFQARVPPIALHFPRYLAFLRDRCSQALDLHFRLGD